MQEDENDGDGIAGLLSAGRLNRDAQRILESFIGRILGSDRVVFYVSHCDGRILHANRAFTILTGYSRGEAAALTPAELFLHPEEHPEGARSWVERIVSAESGRWVDYQRVIRTKRGSALLLRGCAFAAGGLVYGLELDITSHRNAEQELEREGRRLRSSFLRIQIVHSIASQVAALHDIDTLLWTTVRKIRDAFDYASTDVALLEGTRLVCRFFAGADLNWNPIGESVATNEGIAGAALRTRRSRLVPDVSHCPEYVPRRSTPSTRSELAVPLIGRQGPIGVLNMESDRTDAFDEQDQMAMEALADLLSVVIDNVRLYNELQADNERLQQMDRIKREFASILSHDIRSPLTIIRGYAELIEGCSDPTTVTAVHARKIVAEADEITRLADQMLTLFRLDTTGPAYRFEEVDVRELFEKVAPLSDESHPVETTVDDTTPRIMGDRGSLLQLLRNLTSNAIKYSPHGGKVTLHAGTGEPGMVLIDVSDSGIGISPESLPRLFQKFQRIETPEAKAIAGTGLGLYICRRIAEGHGGRIGVTSVPGKGSTFHVLLPAADRSRPPAGG